MLEKDTDEQVLDAMGQRIGYGRVQQIAGQLWDARHGCAPRGSMGVTVKDAAAPAPQRDALLEALKEMLNVWEEDSAYGAASAEKARAAIKAVEGENT